jgi:head-tail adaptor
MVTCLRVRAGTGTKEDESRTGRFWVAGLHHVTAHSRLARVLKLMNPLFL